MSAPLDRDLEQLKKSILGIGALVEDAIAKASLALLDRRVDLTQQVVDGDKEIDRREVEVEQECLRLLALHHPVASNLRFVVTVLKVNNDLERIGDIAANIAKRSRELAQGKELPRPAELHVMVDGCRTMLKNALDAFVFEDVALARKVVHQDDQVDDGHRAMFDGLQERMAGDAADVPAAVRLLGVSRHLERLADLSTNIAEDVIFMIEGKIVRHRPGRFHAEGADAPSDPSQS